MKLRLLALILLISINFPYAYQALAEDEDTSNGDTQTEVSNDFDLYYKYEQYLKYKKGKKYKEYKEAKEKYAFKDQAERLEYKDAYDKYRMFKQNPARYASYVKYYEKFNRYKKYKSKYKPLAKYSKYKKYNKSSYKKYSKYGGSSYKAGYERYKALLKSQEKGEADLGGGTLGPEISVGLWNYSRDGLRSDPFRIEANKAYRILDGSGNVIAASVDGATLTYVTYLSDGNLKVYGSIADTTVSTKVTFDAADGNNTNLIFNAHRPDSDYDQYRDKMSIRYSDDSKNIWAINYLPMEHYVWGMGETTGKNPEHTKVMTVIFRTYGYWKLKFSTKYAKEGFKVSATPGNQIYNGYEWEDAHSTIKSAAESTRGQLVMHSNEIALTPYSSWTDGRTRSFEERWGSTDYPWCQSVSDPYGKHPSMTTAQLEAAGNHMVGLSAHGSVSLDYDHGKNYDYILHYYFHNIRLLTAY